MCRMRTVSFQDKANVWRISRSFSSVGRACLLYKQNARNILVSWRLNKPVGYKFTGLLTKLTRATFARLKKM